MSFILKSSQRKFWCTPLDTPAVAPTGGESVGDFREASWLGNLGAIVTKLTLSERRIMSTTSTTTSLFDEVREKALVLSEKDRAKLAHELLETLPDDVLDEAGLEEFESAWKDEIVRRSDELRTGKVTPISMEQSLENARRALEQSRK